MAEASRLMMPFLQWWRSAPRNQRTGMLAAAGLCVLVAAVAVGVAGRTSYATLFSGLQEKDASAIVTKLQEAKVPYQLADEGTVRVPGDRVHELRLQMASAGLPRGGSVGYEIFDQARLGQSEFQEKLNYRRALQGELERTIGQLAPIEQARVHIALPERQLFAETQEKPSASVILKLRPGGTVGEGEVSAIVHLVAASVEGLGRDRVTVVDTGGNLLSAPGASAIGGGGEGGIATQWRLQNQVERQLEQELQSVLDRALGPGKAVTRVSAVLDFDQRQTQEETYQPESDGHGVLESRKLTRETYNGSARRGGVVGMRANEPAPALPVRPGGDNYEREETSEEYRVSKRVETTTNVPGQVKRLSVALFVDEKVSFAELERLQGAISAAAGLDEQRGDRVVVVRIPFGAPAEKDPPVTLASRLLDWYRGGVGRDLLALAVLGCFALLARGMLRSRTFVLAEGEQAALGGGPRLSLSSQEPALPGSEQVPLAEGEGTDEFGALNQERAADVVRAWLMDEEA